MHVKVNEDEESDVSYSVKATDLAQVTYSTFLLLGSSSSPALGQPTDKISTPVTKSNVTRVPYWTSRLLSVQVLIPQLEVKGMDPVCPNVT